MSQSLTVANVTVGYLNGTTPVVVALGFVSQSATVCTKVLLSENYTMTNPPGYPSRPPAGGAYSAIEAPVTYPSGATIYVFSAEAAAIVAAGGGTITGTGYP